MAKKDYLALDIRRKIYNHIKKSPGLHVREISRELNTPLSTLDYHLYYLKQKGLITAKTDGRYTRYYISGNIGIKDKEILSILRQNVTRKIIMFLLLNPNSPHKKICDHIELAPSTTSFHLNKLIDLEIIRNIQSGRKTEYFINDPDHIFDLLISYRKSFLDKAVDRFIEIWLDINPEYVRNQNKEDK